MNVKEAADLLSNAKELVIAWDGVCIPFNPRSTLEMDAFGDYRVHKIIFTEFRAYGIYLFRTSN